MSGKNNDKTEFTLRYQIINRSVTNIASIAAIKKTVFKNPVIRTFKMI